MLNLQEELNTVPKFDLTGFSFIKDLGEGSYGSACLAEKENEKIVIKQFFKPRNNDINIEELIIREIKNLSFCKHDQMVIRFRGISYTDLQGSQVEYPLLIQNYAEHGSLGELLKKSKKNPNLLDDVEKMIILYGTAKSMQYLHNFHIVHRDLKPDNILLDKNGYPLLSDFGSSRTIVNTSTAEITSSGTPQYSAPEVFQSSVHENYSMQSDVFSFGMIMYAILTGKSPYEDIKNPSYFKISKFLEEKKRFPLPHTIPSYFRLLITLAWQQQPKERPSFSEIVELFDAGIILPSIAEDENKKKRYFQYTQQISNSGCFDKKNLIELQTKLKDKDNKPKLSAIITLFLADYFNDKNAQTKIGRQYINGIVFKINRHLGFDYLKRATDQNDKEALFFLGQCYENGIGCEINKEKSIDCYNKSANLGFTVAQNYLQKKAEFASISIENAPVIIIIGSVASGKTTFINKMINIHNNSETTPTLVQKDYFMPCTYKEEKFYVKVRDTQGMEQFARLLPNYCREADVAMVMFDVNNSKSFDDIDDWITQLRDYNDSAKLIIIANKIDLEWSVPPREEILEKVKKYNAKYIEVSGLKGINIESAVKKIIKCLKKINDSQKVVTSTNVIGTAEMEQQQPKKKKCCK